MLGITFAGIELTDASTTFPDAVRVNGTTVSDVVDIIRASRKSVFGRGNDQIVFSFSVIRLFTSVANAEVYALTQHSLMPKFGLMTITCGTFSDTPQTVTLSNCALQQSQVVKQDGLAITVSYSFTAGGADTTTPPGLLTPISTDPMIQKGQVALTGGQTQVTVNFPQSYAAGTVIVFDCKIAVPTGAAAIGCTIIADATGVNSGTARFDVPIPGAAGAATSYVAMWSVMG